MGWSGHLKETDNLGVGAQLTTESLRGEKAESFIWGKEKFVQRPEPNPAELAFGKGQS